MSACSALDVLAAYAQQAACLNQLLTQKAAMVHVSIAGGGVASWWLAAVFLICLA